MLVTTDEIKAAWLSPSRQLSIRVTMNDITYGSEDITSLSFDSGSISGETYQIGSTYMNSIQIIFPSLIETVKEDMELLPELGVLVNGTYEYTKLGHFFIDEFERNRNNNTTTIKATDKMRFMEGPYESKLSYPRAYKEVALEIANLSGVEVNQNSFASLGIGAINKPEGYTFRQAIGLIAQFEGGFASFNRNGELEIRRLAPANFEITPESYMLKGFTKNEVSYRIGGITVKTGEEETDVIRVGSTNGSQVQLENKVMTQQLLNQIWDSVKNLNYFPYELKWRGCPPLEAGDWIYITANDGTKYSVPNLSYSITFNGGMSAESKATTSSSSQATYKYRGSLNQRIDYLDSILSSNNWNSNYYDSTEPPNPKEGDVWFKPNGKDTEIWVYKNVDGVLDWVMEITSAGDPELLAAIEKAKDEAEKAQNEANTAVDKANEAVAKVDSLDKAVNTALEQSASAIDQAQQAIKDANNLLTTVTDVQGTVTNISAVVDEINNQLAVKVSQTDFDKLKGTVDTQAVQISANAAEIALKASQSSVNTITGNIESIQSELSVQAGSITAINSRVDGQQTQIGTLQSSYSGLSSTIANVKNDFDNLQLGGRNLLLQSSVADRTVISSNNATEYPITKTAMSEGSRNFVRVKRANPNSNPTVFSLFSTLSFTLLSEDIRNVGAITVSFSARTQVPSKWSCMAYYYYPQTDAPRKKDLEIDTQWKRFSITFDSIPSEASALRFNPQQVGMDNSINLSEFYLDICEYKVEKGNKGTDWSPAPEDLATITEMSNITQTVKDIQATVADKVSQAQFTILSNQVTTTVSSINEELAKKKTNRDFKTSNTAASDSKKWTKFARTRLTRQYQDAAAGLDIIYNGDGGALPKPSTIYIRHKQQNIMGQTTLVEIALTDTSEIKAEDLAAVVTSLTTTESVVEYYIRNNIGYSVLNFAPFNEVSPDKISYFASQPFLDALPTSVQPIIYGIERGNLSEVNKAFSQITQLSDLIDMRVTKGDVIGQITTEAGRVLIGAQSGGTGNYLLVTPDTTYIQNATIKSAHIADASITNAKIANATISSAKIISLDVSKLAAGTMDTSKITIYGGSSTNYVRITTNQVEQKGVFNRTWQGTKTEHDTSMYLQNGYFRARNNTLDRSLYFSDFGISTFADGDGGGSSSGTIAFFDRTFNSDVNGLTLTSNNGVVALKADGGSGRVWLESEAMLRLDATTGGIALRPNRDARTGNNTFFYTIASTSNASEQHGYIVYGSESSGYAAGLRFSKGASDPRVSVVDGSYATGGVTTLETGIAEVNSVNARSGLQYVGLNRSVSGMMDFFVGKTSDGTKRMGSDGLYSSSGSGKALHITSGGSIVAYSSSERFKEQIQDASDVNAKALLNLELKSWIYKSSYSLQSVGEPIRRVYGLIAEDVERAGLNQYVERDIAGLVEGYKPELWTVTIPILREHEESIESLKKRVALLESQVRVLQAA